MAEESKVTTEATAAKEGKKTASKTGVAKQKKPNGFVRFFKKVGKFLKDCKSETKKIVWSSPSSTMKNTILCVAAIVVFAALFFLCDWLFADLIIEKLRSIPRIIANGGF